MHVDQLVDVMDQSGVHQLRHARVVPVDDHQVRPVVAGDHEVDALARRVVLGRFANIQVDAGLRGDEFGSPALPRLEPAAVRVDRQRHGRRVHLPFLGEDGHGGAHHHCRDCEYHGSSHRESPSAFSDLEPGSSLADATSGEPTVAHCSVPRQPAEPATAAPKRCCSLLLRVVNRLWTSGSDGARWPTRPAAPPARSSPVERPPCRATTRSPPDPSQHGRPDPGRRARAAGRHRVRTGLGARTG